MSERENRLAEEIAFYNLRKSEWVQLHSGEYVVLRGTSVLGFYGTFKDAYLAGAIEWGPSIDFLVKQVLEHEPVFSVF